MKNIILLVLLAFASISFAQDGLTKQKYGFEFQSNSGEFIFFKSIMGAAGTNSQWSPAFGLHYGYNFKKRSWFETGVLYQKVKSEITPAPTGLPVTPYSVKTDWLEIPFQVRQYFVTWFYAKAGLNMIIQISSSTSTIDNQSGLGISGAAGFDFRLKKSLHLEIEPGIKVLSIVPFASSGYQRHYFAPFLGFRLSYHK